jgi:hypothetical protein
MKTSTIVLTQGILMIPRRWENWISRYQVQSYCGLVPAAYLACLALRGHFSN